MPRKRGYHVAGGFVRTARCTIDGMTYTKGAYSEHVARHHRYSLGTALHSKNKRGRERQL